MQTRNGSGPDDAPWGLSTSVTLHMYLKANDSHNNRIVHSCAKLYLTRGRLCSVTSWEFWHWRKQPADKSERSRGSERELWPRVLMVGERSRSAALITSSKRSTNIKGGRERDVTNRQPGFNFSSDFSDWRVSPSGRKSFLFVGSWGRGEMEERDEMIYARAKKQRKWLAAHLLQETKGEKEIKRKSICCINGGKRALAVTKLWNVKNSLTDQTLVDCCSHFKSPVLNLWRHLEGKQPLCSGWSRDVFPCSADSDLSSVSTLTFEFFRSFRCVHFCILLEGGPMPPLPVYHLPFCLPFIFLLISCEIPAFYRLPLRHPEENQRLPDTFNWCTALVALAALASHFLYTRIKRAKSGQ